MSRHEPSSPMMRGWDSFKEEPKPPKPKPSKPQQGKGRNIRVRVEPKKKRNAYKTRWKDLTPEEMASFRLYPEEGR